MPLKFFDLSGIAREQAALRMMGARQGALKREQRAKLQGILNLTPRALRGDRMAQQELAVQGAGKFPKSDAEIASEEADKNRRAQSEAARLDLAKTQEKRLETQHKERMEQTKALSEDSKRRSDKAVEESKRRFETQQTFREEGRKTLLRKDLGEETRKSKESLAEFEANKKLWAPLADSMFPKMTPEEQEAQVEALARRRAPSVSEQQLPRILGEERAKKITREQGISTLIEQRFPPPTLPPVTQPTPPTRVTAADRGEQYRKKREDRNKQIDALLEKAPFRVRRELAKLPREAWPAEYQVAPPPSAEQLEQEVARLNEGAIQQWEQEMQAAQEAEARNNRVLQSYAKEVEKKKAILRSVPGAAGLGLAGLTQKPTLTPTQKGRMAAKQKASQEDFALFLKLEQAVKSGSATAEQQAAYAEAKRELESAGQ